MPAKGSASPPAVKKTAVDEMTSAHLAAEMTKLAAAMRKDAEAITVAQVRRFRELQEAASALGHFRIQHEHLLGKDTP